MIPSTNVSKRVDMSMLERMKKEFFYTVTPMHGMSFPDDMLRYDAARIVGKNEDGGILIVGKYPPTVERWKSFGWEVHRPT